jgi:hypothetical protein
MLGADAAGDMCDGSVRVRLVDFGTGCGLLLRPRGAVLCSLALLLAWLGHCITVYAGSRVIACNAVVLAVEGALVRSVGE